MSNNIVSSMMRGIPYLTLGGTVVLFAFNHALFSPLAGEYPIITSLNNLQEQVLSTLNDMTQLLISLSTAMFGLIGYFALENYKSTGTIETKFRFDFLMSSCAAAISIDYGYIFMDKLVEHLSNGIFQPYDFLLSVPRKLQLFFFFFALFFCGKLIYRSLFNTETSN